MRTIALVLAAFVASGPPPRRLEGIQLSRLSFTVAFPATPQIETRHTNRRRPLVQRTSMAPPRAISSVL